MLSRTPHLDEQCGLRYRLVTQTQIGSGRSFCARMTSSEVWLK